MHPLLASLFARFASASDGPAFLPPSTGKTATTQNRATLVFLGIDEKTALALAKLPEENLLDLPALARLARSFGNTEERDSSFAEEKDCSATEELPAPRPHFTCGIISAKTGRCAEDCTFCAQSAHHRTQIAEQAPADYDTLARKAEELTKAGAHRFGIVTSGHTLSLRERERLCEYAVRLRRSFPLALCASLGKVSVKQAGELWEAGFTRYHHNVETSASYYPAICTTHTYEERLATIRNARNAGLEVCAGGIFGLGESWEHRVEMAFTLRDLQVDSLPLNFLNPIPGTPLAARPALSVQEALRCIALFRLVHPQRDVLVCGGREFTLGPWQPFAFAAGANGLMVGNYLTTAGSNLEADARMLAAMGLGSAMKRQ